MRLISNRARREFARRHPDAEQPLQVWRRLIESGSYGNFTALRATFASVHEALGIGAPIKNALQYERALAFVDEAFDAGAADGPLGGLLAVLADRIREYEDRTQPWPADATPAHVLAGLMREHGLRQSDLPEVGSQGVVSEVLAGKRQLNARQIKALMDRFRVPAQVLLP